MIEKTKCRSCRAAYEITWDDCDLSDWDDDEDDREIDEDLDDPVYCPFCGTHMDYDE
jgi:hypothetical protein